MHYAKYKNSYSKCFLSKQKAGSSLNPIRQRGAILLVVTFSLIALFGLAALVIDMDRMYIIKNQLQNAADAGALRGAKALDGTLAGIALAETKAREAASDNNLLLVPTPKAVSNIDVYFASEPFPASWTTADATCRSTPAKCFFVRVDTHATGIASFFAGLIGVGTNAAKALAVAGHFSEDITPLAACLIDENDCPATTTGGTCGYTPGLSYKVSEVNPIGPGTIYWIDPEAIAPPCKFSSANAFRPYICQGKISSAVAHATTVYTNTGLSAGPTLGAMDSRFGDYPSSAQCSPDTAPPDTNIMQYLCPAGPDCKVSSNFPSVTASWAGPAGSFTTQSANRTDSGLPPMHFDNNGEVWGASRPNPSDPHYNNFTYGGTTRAITTPPYPVSDTPYEQTSGSYFSAPTGAGAPYQLQGRRLLNLMIVKCTTAGGLCRPAEVKGIGKFFLSRRTNVSSDKEIYLEFVRMVSVGELETEIKLYR